MRLHSRGLAAGLIAVLSAAGTGCEKERDPLGAPVCTSWKTEVQALVNDSCTSCHGADVREGDYALHEYVEAVARDATGRARIVPGDGSSPLLTVLEADDLHGQFASLRPTLERWVVTCEARFVKTDLHAAGIMRPDHADFHGQLIRDAKYDLSPCQECHGDDFSGGSANASCLNCHEQGPDDCTTCHGNPPAQGAHQIHVLGGTLERATACDVCHVVPDDLLSPGHVLTADGELDPAPVEVRFAGDAISPDPEAPAPTYVPDESRCDNVYCHGGTLDDAAATMSQPTWHAQGPLGCDSCHGNPPAEHPGDDCARCHLATVDDSNALSDLTAHLNREVDFAAQSAGCAGCHGSEASPAPGPDLEGRTDRREVTVGVHQAHLFPTRGLNLVVACEECHRVPATVTEFGHLNGGPAEVFPAVQGVGTLASADGATPTWNRETATCSDVYCHGGGARLSADNSASKLDVVVWNDPQAQQVYCGSCHGLPPDTNEVHEAIDSLEQCFWCHRTTVDEFGNILPNGDHLNGSFTD